jgi:hypothetical protein
MMSRPTAARALAFGAGILFAAAALGAQPPAPEKIARARAGQVETARADWWGFDAADATAALQAALTSGVRRLTIPDMGTPWIVHPLSLPSDLELTLEPGTVIEAIRGGFKGRNDALFTALGQSNLVIRGHGATLRMHKRDYQDTNLYARAEWRHTLSLLSCENVRVEGLTLKSSGGDGLYIGGRRNQRLPYCKDIVVRDCDIDDHHRQGISVICVHHLLIERCRIRNTSGTPPQAGIDFEGAPFYRVAVRDCLVENNVHGIIIQTHLRETSPPMSFAFGNVQVVSNRLSGFAASFGTSQPPMAILDCTMTNCVEISAKGRVKRLDDFWRDLMQIQPLNAEQQNLVRRLAKVDVTQVALRPLQGVAAPRLPAGVPPPRPAYPVQRGPFQYVLYADAGETVAFTATFRRIGEADKPMPVKIRSPDGGEVPLAHAFVRNQPETFTFTAGAGGAYLVSCDPGGAAGHLAAAAPPRKEGLTLDERPVAAPRPVALVAQDRPFHFFGQPGCFYFHVPAGIADCCVLVAGSGGERVKATLYDPAGRVADAADDICLAHRFFIHRDEASRGEVWMLRTERPSNYSLEDYEVDLFGIPPILSTTLDGLLAP